MREILDSATELFDRKKAEKPEKPDIEKSYAKIGQLLIEKNFLNKNLKKLGL